MKSSSYALIVLTGLFAQTLGCSKGTGQKSERSDDDAQRTRQPAIGMTASQAISAGTAQLPSTPQDGTLPTLSFYVVTSNAFPGGRFIDTPKFPKLGFIGERPIMVISNLQNLRVDQHPTASERKYLLRLTATAPDAIAIASLTRTNLLKQILLCVDEEPIMAPTVFAIIEHGELEISSTNRAEIETLWSRLMRITR